MRQSVFFAVLFLLLPGILDAQVRSFPYEATITQNETYVRSGPGTRYYPTTRLAQGTRITVHRHDPGGWYMISPPAGSFSWIRAEYVQSADGRSGVVNDNQIVVRVGTEFGDTRDVEQKRLAKGDRVDILGEQTFATEQGPIRMFKIAPPRGEYRWVPGQFVVPVDAVAKADHDRSPFNIPADLKPEIAKPKVQPDPFDEPERAVSNNASEGNRTTTATVKPGDAIARNEPQANAGEVEQLHSLDLEFRRIVRLETAQWDFRSLEDGYRQLQLNASTPEFESQLSQRFAALSKYQKIKDQYDDFVRLTQETAERDARLIGLPPGAAPPVMSRSAAPRTVNPPAAAPQPQNVRRAPAQPSPPPQQKFDGAGIIQRSAVAVPGYPAHVLLAPNGQILAYLQPTADMDLNRYLGQPMGVIGTRTYRTDLQSDFIEVRGLVPVQLRP